MTDNNDNIKDIATLKADMTHVKDISGKNEKDIKHIEDKLIPDLHKNHIKPISVRLSVVEAWQNKSIGYVAGFSALLAVLISSLKNYIN